MRFRWQALILFAGLFFAISPSISVGQDIFVEERFLNELSKAEAFKENIITDRSRIFSLVNADYNTYIEFLLDHRNLREILDGSIPFVGCLGSENTVYGYFDPALHTWIIVWLNSQHEVVNTRLSLGFAPIETGQDNSWIDLMAKPDATGLVVDNIREALDIQIASFLQLFPYNGCVEPELIDFVFSENDAIYTIADHFIVASQFTNSDIESMKQIISQQWEGFNSDIEVDSIKINYIRPNVLDLDVFSISSLENRPDVILVHGFRRSPEMTVVYEEFDTIMREQ